MLAIVLCWRKPVAKSRSGWGKKDAIITDRVAAAISEAYGVVGGTTMVTKRIEAANAFDSRRAGRLKVFSRGS